MRSTALLLALVLAGCLEAAPAATRGADVYRFIEVRNDFRAEPDPNLASTCGYASPPEVDEANRTVTFHNDWPGRSMRALLLTVTWDSTYCGTAHASFVTSASLSGFYDEVEGGGHQIELRDGELFVGNALVPVGETATLHDNGTLADGRAYEQTTRVTHHGDWPRAGVSLAG